MTVREAAQALLDLPNQNAFLLVKAAGDWADVIGFRPTGEHRNAMTPELGTDAGTDSPIKETEHEGL